MQVSVIVPIYKVSAFIARCAESLMMQTLQDVEYIFVNDATPDDSMQVLQQILDRFPQRKEQVRVLVHEVNQGLPAARNTGFSVATGEYVFHCDSDDFVEPDMLEKMYLAAKAKDADLVWSDWYLSYQNKERYMKQPDYSSAEDALRGAMAGTMKYNVWNKLVRRSLYSENGISFPAGFGMGEDMTMIRLLACADKVAYVAEAFYHYVKMNTGAMTAMWSEKHLKDLQHNVQQTVDFVLTRKGSAIDLYIAFFKLNVKLPFLISDDRNLYRLWQDWYPESNAFIWQNKDICLRTRALQLMAGWHQFWVVWLYYKIVQQGIYSYILGYR